MTYKNIRFLFYFLIIFPLICIAEAQNISDFRAKGKTSEEIIGKDWRILDQKSMDFNHDNKVDQVLALEYTGTNENRQGERQLLILAGNDKGFQYYLSSKSALLSNDEGGIFGDPFSEIKIKKDSFILSHYGGSAWRWGSDIQFRYQKDQWVMIGKKIYGYFNGIHCEKLDDFSSSRITDINYLTGERYEKEITEECHLKIDRRFKQKKLPLLRFEEFDIHKEM